jgi:hypothetical protein
MKIHGLSQAMNASPIGLLLPHVWLYQKMIADLFQVVVPPINEHIKNIHEEGELFPPATSRKFLMVQTEGSRHVSRQIDYYNLEMILAIGCRVRL